ncbi:ATP-binding protein [Oryzobacter sp. R7]|uniref:ATP-binding protein n=1 Tax=Oryzobacter faecalis TaxID=3388656 RepID=UPI00398D094F
MTRPWAASLDADAADDVGFSPEDAAALLRRHTEILDLVARGASRRLMLDRVVVAIEELIPDSFASILLYDRARRRLRHGSDTRLPASYMATIDGIEPGPSAGSCGTAAYLNRRVVVQDVRTDDRWRDFREAAREAGVVACWSTPIGGRDGRPVGTFALYHREPHEPSAREQRLVDRFCYLASVVIEHTRVLDELIANEQLFRRSFEDNAAGMLLLDLDLRVARANTAAERLIGVPASGLAGEPVTSLLGAPPGQQALFESWLTVGSGTVTQEVRVTTHDGQERSAEATASAIHDAAGVPTAVVVTVLDLTEREAVRHAEQARREAEVARTTAERHSQAKSQLLTTVSHEIRSPLQAITGFTELLSTLDLDERRRGEALRQIDVAAHHLLDIVTDVLDLTKVEAAALPLRLEQVDLRRAAEEAIDLVTPLARSREVRLVLGPPAQVHARADARRVVQVVLNLLRNAVQHGSHGGQVSVRVLGAEAPASDGGQWVTVEVSDDGPGIPEAMMATVFTPWVHHPEGADGFGLGLGLARRLAEAMDGELAVRPSPEGGARVSLRLPACDSDPAGGAP